MNKYFSGKELYGDDFNDEQLRKWFEEETDAYYNIYVEDGEFSYEFHAVDKMYGFKYIDANNLNVLGIGSANGEELLPIWSIISQLTIIENSIKYLDKLVDKTSIKYILANYKGIIEADDNTFDLVICFSTLHHIANVSFVMSEIARVLKKGGMALIREPVISMGDWRRPRKGLTKNERGIPLSIFRKTIQKTGLTIISENIWNFRPFFKLLSFYKGSIYNNSFLTMVDRIFCRLLRWNVSYHFGFFHRIAPNAVLYVIRK